MEQIRVLCETCRNEISYDDIQIVEHNTTTIKNIIIKNNITHINNCEHINLFDTLIILNKYCLINYVGKNSCVAENRNFDHIIVRDVKEKDKRIKDSKLSKNKSANYVKVNKLLESSGTSYKFPTNDFADYTEVGEIIPKIQNKNFVNRKKVVKILESSGAISRTPKEYNFNVHTQINEKKFIKKSKQGRILFIIANNPEKEEEILQILLQILINNNTGLTIKTMQIAKYTSYMIDSQVRTKRALY